MLLMKTSTKNRLYAVALVASLLLTLLGNGGVAFAQSGFEGDYDLSFAGGDGYYVDPEKPIASTVDTYATLLYTGELLPDGSIIAGGQHSIRGGTSDFYLRKFTPTGAVDASFGTNGFVLTNFYSGVQGPGVPLVPSDDVPRVLKVQPDGKILLAGQCNIAAPEGIPWFGTDACVVRYNPNGSIDTSFGNVSVMTGGGINSRGEQNPTYIFDVGESRFITQTGALDYPGHPGPRRGTFGKFYDMAIQPDGKIVLVGETQNEHDSGNPSIGGYPGVTAFIMRLNANGTLDDSFGTFGIIQMAAEAVAPGCYPKTSFQGMRLQADGRIIAVGYNEVVDTAGCANRRGQRFLVTRWTSAGQPETMRHLDNNTTYSSQREGAVSVLLTRDGNHLLVSGAYKDLNATSGTQKPTMVRLNLSDLSPDTTFGTGGIRQYNGCSSVSCTYLDSALRVKSIQPDGKILGTDGLEGNVVRFNSDGTSDQSFGNESIDGTPGLRGRLRVFVQHFNGVTATIIAGQILVRPNGRINLLGYSAAYSEGFVRAVVSQQNTELPSYTLAGRVLSGSGATAPGVAGVTVKLTVSKVATTTTDATGNYSFTDVPLGGNYTVTPLKAGLSMSPASKSFNNLSANQLNVNFTVPGLSVNNVTVTEANTGATTTATFTVKLSPASTEAVTVKYKTLNGTAIAPADYTALPLTTLTFAPGQISKTITAQVKGDAIDEANETFKLQLSAPTKAVISDNEGICTITDNDPLPSVTISDATVREPDSGVVAATFTVKLSAASGQTVTVKYATGGGMGSIATAGTDYVTVPLTTLTFLPGQTTKTVTVQVKGDTIKEANETFFVNLSGAVNGAITDAKGLGTITNDD